MGYPTQCTEWGGGGERGERGEGEDKDGRVEGEVEGRKKGKMKRRSGYPSLSSINDPFPPFRLILSLFFFSSLPPAPLPPSGSSSFPILSLPSPLILHHFFVHRHMTAENIPVDIL